MKVLLLFFLATVATCLDFPVVQEVTEEPKNCTKAGPMCETCHASVFCLELEPNIFEKRNRLTCGDGETCSDKKSKCTKDGNPKCDAIGLPFICGTTPGMYPHPTDWSIYYMCVPQIRNNQKVNVAIPLSCPDDFYYNPATTFCSIPSNCTSIGETPLEECMPDTFPTANPLNKSLFYICGEYNSTSSGLYPFQDACPKGGIFDNGRCTPAVENGCSDGDTSTTTESGASSTESTTASEDTTSATKKDLF